MPVWTRVDLDLEPFAGEPVFRDDPIGFSASGLGKDSKTPNSARQPYFEAQLSRLAAALNSNALPVFVDWNGKRLRMDKGCVGHAVARKYLELPKDDLGLGVVTEVRLATSAIGALRENSIKLRDLLSKGGRLFVKSEFAPAHAGWPAVSFSSRKIAADFSAEFRRDRDFVLFVGTADAKSTENPKHRSKVLSAVTFEPHAPISTNQIVPSSSWEDSVAKWGVRWEWSLPITDSYDFEPLLDARVAMPVTYASLGQLGSLGRCVPVNPADLDRLLDSTIVRRFIGVREAVAAIVSMNPADGDVRKALSQVALNIEQRILRSGQERPGRYPERRGPNFSDIFGTVNRRL